jgi:hypothetical protein
MVRFVKLSSILFTFILLFVHLSNTNDVNAGFTCQYSPSTYTCQLLSFGNDCSSYPLQSMYSYCQSRTCANGCLDEFGNCFLQAYFECSVLNTLPPTPNCQAPDYCRRDSCESGWTQISHVCSHPDDVCCRNTGPLPTGCFPPTLPNPNPPPSLSCGAGFRCLGYDLCCVDISLCPSIPPTPPGLPSCSTNQECVDDFNGEPWGYFDQYAGCTYGPLNGIECYPVANPPPPPRPLPALCSTGSGTGINTAIGCIPITNEEVLTTYLLQWGIGIGGGIAFLLIVLASFMLITSGGNPERLSAGKELLIAAIGGLLMLILSAYVLTIIGIDILRIPGL